jgi:hypothetical protein
MILAGAGRARNLKNVTENNRLKLLKMD